MYLVSKKKDETLSLPCMEVSPESIKSVSSALAQKIISKIADKPNYPKELARLLKVHEQKIYYHIKKLVGARIIVPERTELHQGAIAKYYALAKPSFAVRFKDFRKAQKIEGFSEREEFLDPFIKDGELNAIFVVGHPFPHGHERGRSRDSVYAANLALFFGSFIHYAPSFKVKFDVDLKQEDLKNNLIVLGGPLVNSVAHRINKKMPIRFVGKSIYSTISKKSYASAESGLIVKADSPFDKNKKVLFIAGNGYRGTGSCVVAFLKYFDEIAIGNSRDKNVYAKVVEGIDLDSDGVVDSVEIKE